MYQNYPLALNASQKPFNAQEFKSALQKTNIFEISRKPELL